MWTRCAALALALGACDMPPDEVPGETWTLHAAPFAGACDGVPLPTRLTVPWDHELAPTLELGGDEVRLELSGHGATGYWVGKGELGDGWVLLAAAYAWETDGWGGYMPLASPAGTCVLAVHGSAS